MFVGRDKKWNTIACWEINKAPFQLGTIWAKEHERKGKVYVYLFTNNTTVHIINDYKDIFCGLHDVKKHCISKNIRARGFWGNASNYYTSKMNVERLENLVLKIYEFNLKYHS